MQANNLFNTQNAELATTVTESRKIKVERVVTHGQVSPAGAFCPQEGNDYLLLLKGGLVLEYQATQAKVTLKPGDHIVTKPQDSNRVDWVAPNQETLWLKISFQGLLRKNAFPSPDAGGQGPALIEAIAETEDVRIERVATNGQASANSCTQSVSEWLAVLKGQAVIEIGGESQTLVPGDHVFIPAGTASRVVSASDDSSWLAAYFKGAPEPKKYPVTTGY